MKEESEDFSMERIDHAIDFLYGKRENVVKEDVYNKVTKYTEWSATELKKEYDILTQMESQTEHELKDIKDKYPEVVKEESIDNIIEILRIISKISLKK